MATLNPQSWAVLIGIDHYSDKHEDENLYGCVNDVEAIRKMLESRLKMPSCHTTLLTAPHSVKQNPPSIPTKLNVIGALKKIAHKAQKGDFVYIHYSGHGDRAPTIYPALKEAGAKDEVLCTLEEDIRDVEFGDFLDNMVIKGLTVLTLLDCCYSGGATRAGSGNRVRCRRITSGESDTDPDMEKASNFRGLRNAVVSQNWFYRGREYNLIAACQPHELAAECRTIDGTIHGAITHKFLESLESLDSQTIPVSYGKLQEVLEAKSKSLTQQPMLLGDRNRLVFKSVNLIPETLDLVANILKADSLSVTLDRGFVSGISVGDRFHIYQPSQWSLGSPSTTSNKLPEVIVTKVLDMESEARLHQDSPGALDNVGTGCLTKLYERSRPAIARFTSSGSQDPIIASALDNLKQNWPLYIDPCAPIHLNFSAELNHANFYLEIDSDLCFRIKDQERKYMQNIPRLRIDAAEMPKNLMSLLQHLQSYQVVAALKRPTSAQSLPYEFEIKEDMVPQGDEDSLASWKIQFKNLHNRPVYVTILNLNPVYGVHQILPDQESNSIAVDPGRGIPELIVDIHVPSLLKPLEKKPDFTMTDVVKLIVTTQRTGFRYYELPDLESVDKLNQGPEVPESGRLQNARVRQTKVGNWVVDQREIVTTHQKKNF